MKRVADAAVAPKAKKLKRGGRKQKKKKAAAAAAPGDAVERGAPATSATATTGTSPRTKTSKKGKKSGAWAAATSRHPFEVTAVSDHAETPAAAYEDVAPALAAAGGRGGTIYDPYYADGGVVARLGALGFGRVVNRNRDFYRDLEAGALPEHDVLVTNPPYSADHIERLVAHVSSTGRPFAILVPTFVLGRAFWAAAVARLEPEPFYVCPHRRYAYVPPAWARRDGAPADAATTAPFHTAWFCWLRATDPRPHFSPRVDVFSTVRDVAQQYRDVTDPLKKRANPKARKRLRARQRQKAAHYAPAP